MSYTTGEESRIGKIGLQLAAVPWLGWVIGLLPFG